MAKATMINGAVTIPAELRDQYGLTEGSTLVFEPSEGGILLRPDEELDVEIYTPERQAEFFLNNVFDADDYAWAVARVREMGLDPDAIPHRRPDGTVR